ncbi:hypothetical protein SODALDRAFT_362999 [Sodiomyces alkalinus F11]|uniref:Uncharacterized protein n=1 Tax=Sodiomyces alkalinus (strain CBS 110278 / VKM F-3762 / F11) TaxID=1314773 RepID=A0A3N2PNN9_SODAK|nr:hypothetical protein SODALDRAFT_362999 [Sodiomyces alkalinus F11]ROT36138.1 hypothetical protein SODALDRAFT_362999 [Sodiomyces alkalinus F11]
MAATHINGNIGTFPSTGDGNTCTPGNVFRTLNLVVVLGDGRSDVRVTSRSRPARAQRDGMTCQMQAGSIVAPFHQILTLPFLLFCFFEYIFTSDPSTPITPSPRPCLLMYKRRNQKVSDMPMMEQLRGKRKLRITLRTVPANINMKVNE